MTSIKISVAKRKSKEFKEFDLLEWPKADLVTFGHVVNWHTNKFYIAASEDGKIVGTLVGKSEAGVTYVDTLLVAEGKRGKGIGKKLLSKAEELSRAWRAHKIYLTTGEKWESVKFYKALGFEISGRLPNHYSHEDHIFMSKFL